MLGIDVSSILNGLITDRNGNFNISVYNGYGDFVSNQNYFIDKRNFKAQYMENMNYAIELNQIEENDDKIITAPSETLDRKYKEFITLKRVLKMIIPIPFAV